MYTDDSLSLFKDMIVSVRVYLVLLKYDSHYCIVLLKYDSHYCIVLLKYNTHYYIVAGFVL